MEAIYTGKFIASDAYIIKEERLKINELITCSNNLKTELKIRFNEI